MKNVSRSSTTPMRRLIPLALLLLAPASPYAGQGMPHGMSLSLQGSEESPPVMTSASGAGEITVLPDRSVKGSIKIKGIAATMAHIHEGDMGKNGPVVIPLSRYGDDTFMVPPNTRLTEAQYASYLDGKLYVNVHSAAHPGGEIRAQLMPATAATSAPMKYMKPMKRPDY